MHHDQDLLYMHGANVLDLCFDLSHSSKQKRPPWYILQEPYHQLFEHYLQHDL